MPTNDETTTIDMVSNPMAMTSNTSYPNASTGMVSKPHYDSALLLNPQLPVQHNEIVTDSTQMQEDNVSNSLNKQN